MATKNPRQNPSRKLLTMDRVCTPEDISRVTMLRARGRTWQEIATDRNVSITTVLSWFGSRIEPVWRALTSRHVHEELAKLNEIERECWLQYEASATGAAVDTLSTLKPLELTKSQKAAVKRLVETVKPTGAKQSWLTTIMAIIDLRARLRGDFAPSKSALSIDASVRVAGSTPHAVNVEMMQRLMDRIEERRNYENALKQAEGSRN